MAAAMEAADTAEKKARCTMRRPPPERRSTGSAMCITSKQMFSPSRSQSRKSTSCAQPVASWRMCEMTAPLDGILTVPAAKSSLGGRSHDWYCCSKSRLNTCPLTLVTRKRAGAPWKRCWNSCTSVAPPFRVAHWPSERKLAMAAASDGFSATQRMVSCISIIIQSVSSVCAVVGQESAASAATSRARAAAATRR